MPKNFEWVVDQTYQYPNLKKCKTNVVTHVEAVERGRVINFYMV